MTTAHIHGSDLFHRIVNFEYPTAGMARAQRMAWTPTPWIVDTLTGSCGSDRDRAIMDWCREHFGEESSPVHGRTGSWHRGCATIDGWTWYGFATEGQMRKFMVRWGIDPEFIIQ